MRAQALAIETHGLDFRYQPDGPKVLDGVTLAVPAGVRCLVVGPNGAGKTTLLHVLAGRHMIPDDAARVLGRPAFHDTSLAARVAFLGGVFPFDTDIRVQEILDHTPGLDESRVALLLDLLGVGRNWHMHRISDGQRKRVQLLLGLVRPPDVMLLDEVTTDLDVVARADLLRFLESECLERGATILYATHIFDGLEAWATHVLLLDRGRVRFFSPLGDVAELADLRQAQVPSPLYRVMERWIRDLR